MDFENVFDEIVRGTYLGEVPADRRTYYIVEGPSHYLLFTFSDALAGNFNLIDRRAVEYVRLKFGGERNVTSSDLFARTNKRQYISDRFDALHVLYILEARKQASRRVARPPARGFLFNIHKPRERGVA